MLLPSERAGWRRGTPFRCLLPLLLAMLVCTSSLFAHAQDAPIVVAPFQGAKKEGVRELVVELLESDGYRLVPSSETPDVDPSGESGYFADMARQGNVKAFVMGYTALAKSGWSTSLTIREGKTGDVVGKVVIEAAWYPGLQKALRERVVARLAGPLDKAKPPGESSGAAPVTAVAEAEEEREPQAASTEEEPDWADDEAASADEPEIADEKPAPASKGKQRGPSSLDLEVGTLFVHRDWRISDSLGNAYDGPVSPEHYSSLFGAQGKLRIYPTGLAGDTSVFRHVGLEGAFARTFVGNTMVPDSVTNPERVTIFQEFTAGLRVRVPAGPVELGLFGGIGRQDLSVAGEKVIAAQPDARYAFYRAGADIAVSVSKAITVSLAGAYRGVTSLGEDTGQVQNSAWFPNAQGAGVEGTLRATYAFTDNLALRLGGLATHYAFDFDPQVDAVSSAAAAGLPPPPIAGGATDLYLGTDLSLVVLLY